MFSRRRARPSQASPWLAALAGALLSAGFAHAHRPTDTVPDGVDLPEPTATPAPAAPTATPAPAAPFAPVVKRLPNGLTLVAVPFEAPGLLAYYSVVRVGSRDEVEPGRTGFAHFFEHMMFRGTAQVSTAQYGATLGKHGADNNAYTTADHTAYHTVGPVAALDDIIALESDRFMHLAYDESVFRTEAGAVLGEYNKAYTAPRMRLYEAMAKNAFSVHPYGHTTMGFEADIRAMPDGFDYARQFFARFYTPDNTTIVVVGDVTPEDVFARLEKAYGGWTGKRITAPVPVEPEPTGRRDFKLTVPTPTPTWICLGWRAPGFSTETPDAAALVVAFELLFGQTSALYRQLVLDEQRVLELDNWGTDQRQDPHLKTVWFSLREAAGRDAVVAEVEAAVARLAAGQVDATAVLAARDHLRYGALLGLESVNDVGGLLARLVGVSGDPEAAQKHLARIAAVTPEQVVAAAKAWLVPQRAVVGSVSSAAEAAK